MQAEANESNLALWDQLKSFEVKHTSVIERAGKSNLTGINQYQPFLKLTEAFGPIGQGWGYVINEQSSRKGCELSQGFNDDTLNHEILTIEIMFWYKTSDGVRADFDCFGECSLLGISDDKMTTTRNAYRNALFGAIKNASSMLGCNADIYLSEIKKPEFQALSSAENAKSITNDKPHDADWADEQIASMKTLPTVEATNLVYKQLLTQCFDPFLQNRITQAFDAHVFDLESI